jgi:hypothetical protein
VSEVLRLHALGAIVDVRCTGARSAVLASAMREAWSRCLDDRAAGPAHDADHLVTAPALETRFEVDGDLAAQLMVTTQEITHSLITAQAGRLMMFHAGAVSNPASGESLVYVAPGGTGKTTLTRRLGVRLGYLTDETVAVDDVGRILPYPKPLSIRRSEGTGKDEVSPDRLGLRRAPASARVGRLLLLDRREATELSRVELEEMSFMDALFALTPQTSSLPALDRPLHRLGALIEDVGPVLRLRYVEAADISDDVAALIGGAA